MNEEYDESPNSSSCQCELRKKITQTTRMLALTDQVIDKSVRPEVEANTSMSKEAR